MPQTLPKHTPYAAWLAGLTLLPEEMDPSRRDAARAVLQNQQAAERFASQPAPQVAMVPQPCQQQQGRAHGATLPPGFTVEADADGDWCLVPPPGVTVVSVPGEPYLLPSENESDAVRDSLALLADWGLLAPRMVAQPVQQQQAQVRETAAEWGARMDRQNPRRAPRPPREDSPAMKAALDIAAGAGRRYGEAQLEVRTKHDIAAAPARAGRYGRAA